MADPSFSFVDVTSFAAWGRRASSPSAAMDGEHEWCSPERRGQATPAALEGRA